MARSVQVAEYAAVGGPPKRILGADGFWAGPTDAGTYRVAYCGKHSSARYGQWSKFLWGSTVKDDGKDVSVMHKGQWVSIATVGLNRDDILAYHQQLYLVRDIPKTWVFNDFGHLTCYFFKDPNNNAKLDKGESIHGEFFHTTPLNEAEAKMGVPIDLDESHGCIHLRPPDVQEMVKRGYFKRGHKVVVHPYSDKIVRFVKGAGKAPYEIHFYPGISKLVIVGTGS